MNIFDMSTATVLALVLSVFIPLVSAAIKWPGFPHELVGIITAVLAAANGFFTEWANSSNANHYDWKTALGIALGSLILAGVGHIVIWKQTPQVEGKLLQFPRKAHERRAAKRAA